MASDADSDDKSQDPGIAMRLTVAGICQKFSTVKNITTGRLSNWMKETGDQSENQGDGDQTYAGNLVILVICLLEY